MLPRHKILSQHTHYPTANTCGALLAFDARSLHTNISCAGHNDVFRVVGGAAGGLSPAELLTQLVDLRGQVKAAERERDRDRLATSQLMAEVEAKAALMQEQQVRMRQTLHACRTD